MVIFKKNILENQSFAISNILANLVAFHNLKRQRVTVEKVGRGCEIFLEMHLSCAGNCNGVTASEMSLFANSWSPTINEYIGGGRVHGGWN